MKTSEEILSKATGIQAYNPTFRERSTRTVANLLRDKFGMDNYKAVELAQDIFGNPNAESILDQLGAATFSPAEALYGGQEGAREFKRADDLVGKGIGAATVGLSAMEAFPATALMAKGIKRMLPKGSPTKDVDLDRRKVTQGIAALPIAATGIAKVIGDLPMGAATATKAAAKTLPKVTGSSLLDKIPFVKDKLSKIYDQTFEKGYDDYLNQAPASLPAEFSPSMSKTPRAKMLKINKLHQSNLILSDLQSSLLSKAPKASKKTPNVPEYLGGGYLNLDAKLSELPISGRTPSTNTKEGQTITDFRFDPKTDDFVETEVPDYMSSSDYVELMDDLVTDSFIKANPNMTVREALESVQKEGRAQFRKIIDETPDDMFKVDNPDGVDLDDFTVEGEEAKDIARKIMDENPNANASDLWYDVYIQGSDTGVAIGRGDVFDGEYTRTEEIIKALSDVD
jgi:hypothetical protein